MAVKDCGVGIADVKQAMEPMFTTDPEGERSGMGFSFMEPLWISWKWNQSRAKEQR